MDTVRAGMAELRGEEARHLTRVLRVEAGQRFEITDTESAYLAEIAEARGDRVVFRVLEPIRTPELPVRIVLMAALIKFDRFEWIVEKATELGVERILPFEAMRSEKGLLAAAQKRAGRWQRIARESSQQSRRLRAPEILPPARLKAVLEEPSQYRYCLEEAEAPPLLAQLPAERPPAATVALLVGPEGGWTDAERAQTAGSGWQPVSLGPPILRAETAAVAAIGIILNAWLS